MPFRDYAANDDGTLVHPDDSNAEDLKFVSITGVDGDPGPTTSTVPGIAVGDTILAVLDNGNVSYDLDYFTITAPNTVVWRGLDLNNFDTLFVFLHRS